MKKEIPKSLKTWFLIHFIIDIIFAIPLIFFPIMFLGLLGFENITLLFPRLVGAALLGIGGTSYFTKTYEQFQIMLTLKIIWSISAILVIFWSIIEGAPLLTWLILGIFVIFSAAWMYYKNRI